MLAEMCWKGYPHTLLVGMSIGAATEENSMEVSQKTKNRTTIPSSNSTWVYIPKNQNTNSKGTCTPVSIEVLFTIARIWEQTTCPPTDDWIKMFYTHTHTHTRKLLSHKEE